MDGNVIQQWIANNSKEKALLLRFRFGVIWLVLYRK